MSRFSLQVRFSFDSLEQKASYTAYAKKKGMSLSALVKMATFQYRERYPGVQHEKGVKWPANSKDCTVEGSE
jgi:hypothetical protein